MIRLYCIPVRTPFLFLFTLSGAVRFSTTAVAATAAAATTPYALPTRIRPIVLPSATSSPSTHHLPLGRPRHTTTPGDSTSLLRALALLWLILL